MVHSFTNICRFIMNCDVQFNLSGLVVLLNKESTDCIPECLRNTVNYMVPDEDGFFDLVHRIDETEPNAIHAESVHHLRLTVNSIYMILTMKIQKRQSSTIHNMI